MIPAGTSRKGGNPASAPAITTPSSNTCPEHLANRLLCATAHTGRAVPLHEHAHRSRGGRAIFWPRRRTVLHTDRYQRRVNFETDVNELAAMPTRLVVDHRADDHAASGKAPKTRRSPTSSR